MNSKKKLYLIEFGLSIFINKQFQSKENYDNIWRCGTNRYMSIDTHKKFKPSVIDDIESLLYSLINLAGIKLPWQSVKTSNYQLHNTILNLKESTDMISLCGKEFSFIAKIFCYLDKIKRHETFLNFEVIYEIIRQEKNNHEF